VVISCLHIHKNNLSNELNLNIRSYERILDFSKKIKVKKIIYISSVNASEDRSLSYSYTKFIIEKIISTYQNYAIIRPSTIISIDQKNKLVGGRNRSSFKLYEKFFKYNIPVPIIGDGKYLFTFCFLKNLVNFVLLLVDEDVFSNKKVNFFSGEYLNFVEFIEKVSLIKNRKIYKFFIPLKFINFLYLLKILNKKKIDNLFSQNICFNYNKEIESKIKINKLNELINVA